MNTKSIFISNFFLFTYFLSSAQQGLWLDLPTEEVSIQYHYTDKEELDTVRYSNGAVASWGYDTMGNRYTSMQVPPPPRAELLCKRARVADTLGIGGFVPTDARVDNEGVVHSGQFAMEVFLSSDTLFQLGTDVLVSPTGMSISNVVAADSIWRNGITLTIPTSTLPGDYYLIYFPDQPNGVTEYSDSNNIFIKRVHLVPCTNTSVVASTEGATCAYSNGSITLDSLPPTYRYNWNNGAVTADISGLSAGLYTLTVTDTRGCRSTSSYMITDTPPVLLNSSSLPMICAQPNGSADIQIVAGTPPYTYQWNTGSTLPTLNSIAAGTYICMVTDGKGCHTQAIVVVEEIPAPTVQVSHQNANCGAANGSAAALVNQGALPYTYLWNTGATTASLSGLLGDNYYQVTMTDANGCTTSDGATVLTTPALYCNITSNPVNNTLNASPTGGLSPFYYHWSTGGQTNSIQVPNLNNPYSVTVTDANGCSVVANNTTTPVIVIAGTQVKVYPNPTGGRIIIEYSSLPALCEVLLYNVQGILVHQNKIAGLSGKETIDLPALASGSYTLLLRTITEGTVIYKEMIVKQK